MQMDWNPVRKGLAAWNGADRGLGRGGPLPYPQAIATRLRQQRRPSLENNRATPPHGIYWKGIDSFVDCSILLLLEQQQRVTRHGARINCFRHLFKGKSAWRDAAQLRAVEVGGKREEPDRQRGLLSPRGKITEGSKEGFLREFFRPASIPAKAIGKVDER